MKRILSIVLCVAMLASVAVMTVYGVGEFEDQVTTENVMAITTDKDSYAPGETVVITASMESIWGDASIEDDIEGCEGMIMPGAYGMDIICANLIYDTSVFTAKAHKSLKNSSTILNMDAVEVKIEGNNPIEAKQNGAYYLSAKADMYNANYDGYGFFNGSGDLWQWQLTISADAKAGTYYLPVGPYRLTDTETAGSEPVIKFADDASGRYWAWLGNTDSLLTDREVTYKTNYDGPSRVDLSDPVTADFGTQYECGYLAITITGEGGEVEPPAPPVEEDPMSFELTSDKDGVELTAGDTVNVTFSVKDNEGLSDALLTALTFNNTALKLTGITTTYEAAGKSTADLEVANKFGTFEDLGRTVEVDTYFENTVAADADGALITATFEVLATAESGDLTITATNIESGLDATLTLKIAGDHKHSFTETTTPAQCTVAGKIEQICSCGLTYKTSDIAKLGHTYDENSEVVYIAPTCDKPGRTVTKCDRCGGTAVDQTHDALGHDLKEIKTEQSCTNDESVYSKCQREGCKYQTEVVVNQDKLAFKHIDPATGKDAWGEPFIAKKPTTSEEGYWAKECQLCHELFTLESIPPISVKYGDVNMDEAINLLDVSTMLKYIAKWDGIHFSFENADVKTDGRVNTLDASHLLKYIANWGVVLGEGSKPV